MFTKVRLHDVRVSIFNKDFYSFLVSAPEPLDDPNRVSYYTGYLSLYSNISNMHEYKNLLKVIPSVKHTNKLIFTYNLSDYTKSEKDEFFLRFSLLKENNKDVTLQVEEINGVNYLSLKEVSGYLNFIDDNSEETENRPHILNNLLNNDENILKFYPVPKDCVTLTVTSINEEIYRKNGSLEKTNKYLRVIQDTGINTGSVDYRDIQPTPYAYERLFNKMEPYMVKEPYTKIVIKKDTLDLLGNPTLSQLETAMNNVFRRHREYDNFVLSSEENDSYYSFQYVIPDYSNKFTNAGFYYDDIDGVVLANKSPDHNIVDII